MPQRVANEIDEFITRRGVQGDQESLLGSSEGESSRVRKILQLDQWYIAYYFPALSWISNYKQSYLFGDICAGVTMASFLLPTCLSYATSLAHVKAATACYGLIVPPLVYAFLGSVPQMVIGPESAISIVVGHAVNLYTRTAPTALGEHHVPDDRSNLSGEVVVALLSGSVGAIILLMGLFRVGFIESIMSRSLLRGFITGVGLVMIVSQLGSLLGFEEYMHEHVRSSSSALEKFIFICKNINQVHRASAIFSACAVSFLIVSRAAKHYLSKAYQKAALFPDTMVLVVLSTLICWFWDLDEEGVEIVGDIKPGKLKLQWTLRPAYWHDFRANFVMSFFISILGFLETTVAARSLGDLDTASSANRELVALGMSNMCGMVFGALPSFGGYGRSKLNRLSGARTQLAAIISSLLTLVITFSLLHYLYYLPKPILATIISMIGVSLLQEAPEELHYFWRVRGYEDIATFVVCFLGTFMWSVEAGVGFGSAIVVLRVIKHATRPRIQILARHPDSLEFVNADDFPREPHLHSCENPLESGILIVKIPEPLTFANVGELGGRLRRLEYHGTVNAHPGRPRTNLEALQKVVFQLSGMTDCDPTAVAELYNIFLEYISRGVVVYICELSSKPSLNKIFHDAGIFQLVSSQEQEQRAIFSSLSSVFQETDIY